MKTVLYVDDDPNDLLLFRSACHLTQVSFRLQVAAGGVQAINYLAGEAAFADRAQHAVPDFILLDLKMPGWDGFDVLRWVRSNCATTHTPLALYTGSLVQADIIRGFAEGANYFITKPSDIRVMSDIARAIDACLATNFVQTQSLSRFSIRP